MSDVTIVIGRGISNGGVLSPDSLSRVRRAIEVYNDGVSSKIIMSGGYSYHLKI